VEGFQQGVKGKDQIEAGVAFLAVFLILFRTPAVKDGF